MNFNQRAAALEDGFRSRWAPALLAPAWLSYQAARTRKAYVPALRRSSRKPVLRVAVELVAHGLRWRCLPFHYLRYGLYDPGVSWKDTWAFLPETVFYYRLLARGNRHSVLLDDKVVCKQLLAAGGVPQPELLLWGEGQSCMVASGERIGIETAFDQFDEGLPLVIKPARYSSGGEGVQILKTAAGRVVDEAGNMFSLRAYAQHWGPWLVERMVVQRSDLAELNSASLNCFRVITIPDADRGRRTAYVVLKLGAGAGLVDNAHDGGLYVRVDPVSGRLDRDAFDETFTRHQHHPHTKVRFDQVRIDGISAVVAAAERAAALFPQQALIGWDIALTEGGPTIIEGNSSPGLTNIQRTHGGQADLLRTALTRPVHDRGRT
ncbi:sugar-transfer associated ATP-grasp domain-containing protein [Glycomyces sp. NPDC047369]